MLAPELASQNLGLRAEFASWIAGFDFRRFLAALEPSEQPPLLRSRRHV